MKYHFQYLERTYSTIYCLVSFALLFIIFLVHFLKIGPAVGSGIAFSSQLVFVQDQKRWFGSRPICLASLSPEYCQSVNFRFFVIFRFIFEHFK